MTSIRVCNTALAHLGDRRITRLDDDAQAADALVRYCAEFYEIAKGEVLEAHRWSFAKKDLALTRTDAPIVEYSFAHKLPTDMLRFMRLIPGSVAPDGQSVYFNGEIRRFRIVGNTVHSNSQYAALRYICDHEDPTMWSRPFIACFTRLLASYLAGPIADSPEIAERHRVHYERIDLPNAIYLDAVQDESNENNDNDIRLAGSGLVQAGRSEGFTVDYYDDTPPGGAGTPGTIIGGGAVIG